MKKLLPFNLLFLLAFIFHSFLSLAQTPVADFTLATGYKNSACGTLFVKFKNLTANQSSFTYEWDFGDNTPKQYFAEPSHSYEKPGTYTVTLKAKNAAGVSDIEAKTAFIRVYKNPIAAFNADDVSGCISHTANFTDLSTIGDGKITNWEWFFGDAQGSTKQNPTNIYSVVGTFNVMLEITDENKCKSSTTKDAYITTLAKPTATFTSNSRYFCPPLPNPLNVCYTYTGTAISPTFAWDFGDGQTSTVANPCNTYAAIKGSYDVKLTVTSKGECSSTVTMPKFVEVNSFKVDFFTNPTSGCPPFKPTFFDLSKSESGNDNAVTWNWTFGTDKTSTLKNANNVTFTDTGKYDVKLVVTTQKGCKDSLIKPAYITVNPLPATGFQVNKSEHCTTPATVIFTDTSANSVKWKWDFGVTTSTTDTSSSQSPTFTYTSAGEYDVKLTITNASGCSNTITKNKLIRITKPDAGFTTIGNLFNNGCKDLTINFKDTSISQRTITKWEWDFGVPNTTLDVASINTPAYTYKDTGDFDVYLKITDNAGCTDSALSPKFIHVGEPQSAGFTVMDSIGCHKLKVKFTDTSNTYLGKKYIDRWEWNYGYNQGKAQVFKTIGGTHTYTYVNDSNYYDVKLIVYQNGCPSLPFTKDSSIYVIPPIPAFTVDSTISCKYPYNATFTNNSYLPKKTYWDFGDTTTIDSTTTEKTINHNYKYPGFYNVTIIVRNDSVNGGLGCRDTLQLTSIVKISDITPAYNQSATHICLNQSINYTDATIPLIVKGNKLTKISQWIWELGDGKKYTNIVNTQLHTYTKPNVYTTKLRIQDDLGCWDSIIRVNNDTVFNLPKATYFAPKTYGCEPFTATFIDKSIQSDSAAINKWAWDFGEIASTNDTSFKQNPSWEYKSRGQFGYYDVKLTITDVRNCSHDSTLKQYIKPSYPYTKFKVKSPICRYNPLQITDETTSLIPTSYHWDFGDGDTSILKSPTPKYYFVEKTDSFTIRLTVTDTSNCDSTFEQKVVISQPDNNFAAYPPTFNCPPARAAFTTNATSEDSLQWNFGENNTFIATTKQDTAKWKYNQAGSYTVTLLTTNTTTGCIDTVIKPDYIQIDGPSGTFTFSPKKGCAPLTVNFKATANKTAMYEWRFPPLDPIVTLVDTIEYTFTKGGYYKPSLILTDSKGCSAPIIAPSDSIAVMDVELGYDIQGDSSCSTDNFISLSNTSKILPENFPVGETIKTIWNLGNGKFAYANDTLFKYTQAGVYTIKLSMQASTCPAKIDSQKVHIFTAPSFDFNISDTTGCIPLTSTLSVVDSLVKDSVLYWIWNFGDNAPNDTSKTVTHTYYTSSINPIQLTAVMQNQCSYSPVIKNVGFIIYELPDPKIGLLYDTLIAQRPAIFIDSSSGNILARTWSFGDDTENDSIAAPRHIYQYIGDYTVKLVVESTDHCIDSTWRTIIVKSHPYIPNAFTPDNDGYNDVFMPYVNLTIINRWGEVLYKGTEGWNGFYHSKLASSGTYYYIITIDDDRTKEPQIYSGPVTLIKK